MNSSSPLIALKQISFSYSPSELVLNSIDLELSAGETLGIIGPNGAGKSTLLKILAGLLWPNSGEVWMNGEHIKRQKDFPRGHIGLLPQATKLNDLLPVRVQDLFWMCPTPKTLRPNHTAEILEKIGLTGKEDQLLSTLSGGERQRALLGRALFSKPKVLILDEPSAGLDSTGEDQFLKLIKELAQRDQTAIVIVDHHLPQIIGASDKVLCLNKTTHWHRPKEFLTKEVLESIYHCELEHSMIHSLKGHGHEHHLCEHGPNHAHNVNPLAPPTRKN